ncbi:hypothetical protein F8388_009352 [Cannabis sativa]|uniref:MADS-box domain-containing protein n=1 Tax=Cannabis sativa TaxID=3483 RepID=A0A7J6GKB4_CANSA|nr:hypothetical protein F8388_009352 [Cannabis sativa]
MMVMVVCGGGLGEEEREEEEGRKEEEDEIGFGFGFHLGTGLLSFYYVQQGSIDLTGFGFGPVSESEETHSLGSQHHSNGLESTLNRPSKWIVSGIFAAVLLGRHDAEAVWFAMAICCIKTIEQETLVGLWLKSCVSKESKGSISLKSFLLSFFDFQSRPGRKGVTDLIKALLSFYCTMGKRSLEEGEEQQQQQKKNKNNKKKPSNMLVSFSKRRDGLFKKASELCVKCGAQITVVILSPAGIPHAFGHTSVDEVLQHYL